MYQNCFIHPSLYRLWCSSMQTGDGPSMHLAKSGQPCSGRTFPEYVAIFCAVFVFTLWGSGSRDCRLKYSHLNPPWGGSRMWCRSPNRWRGGKSKGRTEVIKRWHELRDEADTKKATILISGLKLGIILIIYWISMRCQRQRVNLALTLCLFNFPKASYRNIFVNRLIDLLTNNVSSSSLLA